MSDFTSRLPQAMVARLEATRQTYGGAARAALMRMAIEAVFGCHEQNARPA